MIYLFRSGVIMSQNNKQPVEAASAPALENGLRILEAVGGGGVRFGDLVERLDISRATVSRLLKVLMQQKYVVKDNLGVYRPGSALSALSGASDERKSLAQVGGPVLDTLAEATGCSAILFHWDGTAFEALAKRTPESGPAMQALGLRTMDLSRYPWGWLLFDEMSVEGRLRAQALMVEPDLILEAMSSSREYIRDYGFAFDDGVVSKGSRRLAGILRDFEGRAIGAIGIGGNKYTIPDDKVVTFGTLILEEIERMRALVTM
jgi:DNA-binding IclR family transcriptional regulator